jgi:hypothetical protein
MTQPGGTPSAGPQSQLTADGRARLATALELEHQAVYGYGALGPYLIPAQKTAAVNAQAAHRALLGPDAPAGEAAYALPEAVTDAASALRLAALLEDGVTSGYRAVLGSTDGVHRRLALDAMVDAASRAAAWRRSGGQVPGTVPFPGRPA